MRRSLLAFLLLLFFVLVSGRLLDDVPDGKKAPTEPPQGALCLPNLTSNGVPLNVTISRVLSSPKVLSCADTISKALRGMFQLDVSAEEMRRDTTDSVKDICPAFVNLTSIVVWSGYGKHPGPNFLAIICSKDILTKKAVEDRHFCTFYKEYQSSSTTTLELLEEYPKVASVFQELTSMGGDCEMKCGKGSKRVLCNAFFALARLLSMKGTIEQESKIPNQAKSGSTPTSAERKESTTSSPGPLSPSLDRSDVIRHLATPILSLSRDTLDELVHAAPNMLEFSLSKMEDVSTDLRAELLQLEDIYVILRMFWIVKISPERLRSLSDGSWNAILSDPVLVFPSVMWFEKDVEEEVRLFQNLDQVVKYIYRYRKIILIDLPTLSTDKKPSLDRAVGANMEYGRGDGFDNDEERERQWQLMEQENWADGDNDPKEPPTQEIKPDPPQEKANAKTPLKTKAKPKQSGDDHDDGSTGWSYGPFHFFLIVGAVVVVTYVCMHNRKKKQRNEHYTVMI